MIRRGHADLYVCRWNRIVLKTNVKVPIKKKRYSWYSSACTELLQNMVSSGKVIFRLKQGSELVTQGCSAAEKTT